MAIFFEDEVGVEFDFDFQEVARKVVDCVAEVEQIPYEFDLNITFVDASAIQEINNEFREKDSVTDVLSFPNIDFEKPADFAMLEIEEKEALYFDMESGMLLLGDIVLNIERVKEQAKDFGHSELREYAFLITHSMLHLCGYDHLTKEEAKIMEKEQDKVMQILNIPREI